MQTLYTLPSRQVVDQERTFSVNIANLPWQDVRLVVEVESLDPGSYIDCRIGGCLTRMDRVGKTVLGHLRSDRQTDRSCRVAVVGRARFSARAVAFDYGEDVPEDF
jgi:hypothetical protein